MRTTYKILHLEDVATDAELAARELRKKGLDFEHLVVDTEAEYKDALHNFKPDIILCDHTLPSFNSAEALRIKRIQKLHIPFILITATMSDEVALNLIKEGADDYILKDRLKRLPHAVQNALEKYGREQERKLLIDRVIEKELASQEALKKLTNKLLLANKAAAIGVWDYFVEDGRIVCDDYLLSLYAKTQEEFDGSFDSWLQLLHPDDQQRVTEEVKAAWQNETDLDTEFRVIWPDGSLRYIHSLGIIEYDAAGKSTRMVGTNKDITQRAVAHQALRESEERYRAFFENSMDAILLTAPDGRILAANAAACQIFQKTEAEIIAAGRAGVVDINDPRLPLLLEQRKATGKMRGELNFRRKDGSPFPGDVTSAIYKDINGEERTSMIIRDMTEWKAAQDQLQKSEANLKEAQSLAQLGSWTLDAVHDNLEWSDEVYRIFEVAPEEFGAQLESFLRQVHPDDRGFVLEQYGKSIATQTPTDFTHRIIAGNKVKYVHERLQNFYDFAGHHIRTTGTIQDVTEKYLAEKAIKESEELNQGILDSLSSHVAIVNSDGVIIKVNQPWRSFAEGNGPGQDFHYNEGANYFKACENSKDPEVLLLLKNIKEVLNGGKENIYIEYPCHGPNNEHWFCMRVKRFSTESQPMLLIEHQYITERKIAENKLLATANTLQQTLVELNKIMDSSLDVICTIDEEGRFARVSAAAQNVWGFSPDELVGKKYMDLVYADDIQLTTEVAALVMQGIAFTNFENRYVRKDGSIVPLLWSASWDAAEKTMHCIAKDATEKKRLEAAFESERLRFAALFDQAPSCIGVFKGPDHVFEMANPLYLELTGKRNILGKPVRTVFPELEGQGVFELLDQVYASGLPFSGKELPVKIDRKGKLTKIYSNFIYQPYTDKDGKVEGIFFFSVDVTEQVIARKKIEESEKNYSLLFHNSPLPQFICDKDTLQFVEVNTAALEQYGYTRKEFLSLSPADLQHADDYLATNELWREGDQTETSPNRLLYHRNKTGDKLIVEIKTSEIKYNNRLCVLTTLSDLTQEIRLQEKMAGLKVKAQKKVTQAHIRGQERERAYIGRELHDNINQQLTTAKLYLDLAKDREDMRLSLVEKSEGVIQKTIDEIRNLSKGFMLPTQAELNLEETLRELINTYSHFENLQVHLKCHECLIDIQQEMKLMFYRIIQEQLNNIVKYAACRNVWIEFELFDESIYLLVKDDGKGFDVKAKRKGIGLSNIKGRLELHNGELDIVSAPGEGCAIHILVPLENEMPGEGL